MTRAPGAHTRAPTRPRNLEKSHNSTRIALLCSAALLVASAGPRWTTRTNAPASAATSVAANHPAANHPAAQQSAASGRQKIDGIDYYYELHGAGEPLLLLHGGLLSSKSCSIDMLGPVLDKLAESRQVIAVDLQGHGRTPLGTRLFTPRYGRPDATMRPLPHRNRR